MDMKTMVGLIKDIENNTPMLIMGTAVMDFKKGYGKPIKVVRTTEEVRDLVANYASISSLDVPLVIDDLSFLKDNLSSMLLLKLVEESKFNLILLSLYDKVSPIMLSRVKTIIKYQKDKVESEFMPVGSGLRRVEEQLSADSHYFDRVKAFAKISPAAYVFEKKLGSVKNKQKIIQLLD